MLLERMDYPSILAILQHIPDLTSTKLRYTFPHYHYNVIKETANI